MFNFHVGTNGVQNKILWNDGKGNFTYDPSGIGNIDQVDHAELVDVNGDGYLDLVINYPSLNATGQRADHFAILWGNGSHFGLDNATTFDLPGTQYLVDIGFADLNGDGVQELIISGNDENAAGQIVDYFIEIYQSDDKGKSFVNRTTTYVDNNLSAKRFDHIRVQDLYKNGGLEIFAPDKNDNIIWVWNGTRFIKQ
jgi:hypothetical protein